MRTIVTITMLFVTAAAPARAAAQLNAGDTIDVRPSRAAVPERQWGEEPARAWTAATVIRLSSDTLAYRVGPNLALASVHNVEVRRPTGHSHRVAGALILGAASAAVAATVVYSTFEPHSVPVGSGLTTASKPATRVGDTMKAAAAGALLGGVLGLGLGSLLGEWEAVDLTPALADSGGWSLSARVGF